MPALESTSRLLGRLGDLANPILVKETRQAFKSRQFVVTFLLVLFASWMISTFGVLMAGDLLEYEAVAPGFFFAYYMVLAIAIFIVVPLGAHRSMLAERDEKTLELLTITGLSPRRIVWGKLLSALVQQFLYYSAIAPFIAFTSLLDGFDSLRISFLLTVSALISLGISMFSIMISTVSRKKQWQAFSSFTLFGGLIWIMWSVFAMVGFVLAGELALDDPDFWMGFGIAFIAAATYFVLFQQITVSQLTFEADNKTTAIRATCTIQFVLLFAWAIFVSAHPDTVAVILTFAMLHMGITGLFFCTENDVLSRRVRRSLPKNRLLRLLSAPFLPGGYYGFLYLLIHVPLLWLTASLLRVSVAGVPDLLTKFAAIAFELFTGGGSHWNPSLRALTGSLACVVIFLGLALWIGRRLQRIPHEVQPAHLRVLVVLMLATGTIGPYLPQLVMKQPSEIAPLWFITNPFHTLTTISSRSDPWASNLTTLLFYAAMGIVAINLPALLRNLKELLSDPLPQGERPTAAEAPAAVSAPASTTHTEGSPA